jgi:hypothetical protein
VKGKVTNKKESRRERLATLCLMICLFLNPAGFDAIFKMILDWTGSYWNTVLIFYLAAGLFLGLYFYFARVNPLKVVYGWGKNFINKVKKLFV